LGDKRLEIIVERIYLIVFPIFVYMLIRAWSLLRLALIGEGFLVFVAFTWSWWRGADFVFGGTAKGVIYGLLTAAVLAVANFYLLVRAPGLPGVPSIRRLYAEVMQPMFGNLSVTEIIVISAVAGIGEELLFRGVLQPELGLFPASVIFGLAHMGGGGTLAFGCWVMVMGGMLGILAIASEGLLAPIIAHAVYDAAAMSYIRWDGNERVA